MVTDLDKIAARLGSLRGAYKDTPGALRTLLTEDVPGLLVEAKAARAWLALYNRLGPISHRGERDRTREAYRAIVEKNTGEVGET